MKMNDIPGRMQGVGLKLRQRRPEILLGAAIVVGVASIAEWCRRTIKNEEMLREYKDEATDILKNENRMANEKAVDIVKLAPSAAIDFTKAYWPAMLMTGSSIALGIASHNDMRSRNKAQAAIVAGLTSTLNGMYERTKDRFGEQVANELRYNLTNVEEQVDVVDEKTGKTKKKTIEVPTVTSDDPSLLGPYAFFWDESSSEFTKDPEYNLAWLRAREAEIINLYHKPRLRDGRGYIMEHEVLRLLGVQDMNPKRSHIVGSIYDPKCDDHGENKHGDNYFSLGIFNARYSGSRDFVNGLTPVAILDPNYQGDILDYLD
jgi:hypothetical protein